MPSTHTCLHYHLIFATKHREPTIAKEWRIELHSYLAGVVKGLGGHPEQIGGVADHVHVLASIKPTMRVSDFMRDMKKSSSTWVRDTWNPKFQWQEGYAAFTVSASNRAAVSEYIERQEEHHRTRTFREELIEFLEKSGVDYDARYLD